jgi:hypothetical protein
MSIAGVGDNGFVEVFFVDKRGQSVDGRRRATPWKFFLKLYKVVQTCTKLNKRERNNLLTGGSKRDEFNFMRRLWGRG